MRRCGHALSVSSWVYWVYYPAFLHYRGRLTRPFFIGFLTKQLFKQPFDGCRLLIHNLAHGLKDLGHLLDDFIVFF